jgi:3-hydroxybutyryl-CoA dehydratase
MPQKTFEEYEVGEVFVSHARTITETDVVTFTCFSGLRLPIFIDEEFSRKNSIYKTRIAPGLMTASIAAGMLEGVLGEHTIAALGLDHFKYAAPVMIGDTLYTLCRVSEKKVTSDGRRGVLGVHVAVRNQKGIEPLEFRGAFLMRIGRGEDLENGKPT